MSLGPDLCYVGSLRFQCYADRAPRFLVLPRGAPCRNWPPSHGLEIDPDEYPWTLGDSRTSKKSGH